MSKASKKSADAAVGVAKFTEHQSLKGSSAANRRKLEGIGVNAGAFHPEDLRLHFIHV
jgi:hypothetical protein